MEHASMADQLSQVVGDVEDQAQGVASDANDAVKKMMKSSRRATAQAIEVTKDKWVEGQDILRTGYKKSLSLFRQYPIESAGACLGAGFIVGKVLQSRK